MILALAVVCLGAGAIAADSSSKNDGFAKGGWAEVDITPPLGIALGGRAGPGTKANRVLDPLKAQVLILKDSKGKDFALASFDLVGLPSDLSNLLRTRIVE